MGLFDKSIGFVIAMENLCKDGYVTEKILNAFYSGQYLYIGVVII